MKHAYNEQTYSTSKSAVLRVEYACLLCQEYNIYISSAKV
jgi:hypothetical protein